MRWLWLAVFCVLGAEFASADCGDDYPGAFVPDSTFRERYFSVYPYESGTCIATESMAPVDPLYEEAKAYCEALPGFVEWQRDRGTGFHLCAFEPSSGDDDDLYDALDEMFDDDEFDDFFDDDDDDGPNGCMFAHDGTCDEPDLCRRGTDTADCSAGGGEGADSHSQSQGSPGSNADFYELTICNRHSRTAYVALHWYDPPGWIVEGWWPVQPGECKPFGTYRDGPIYWYAEAADGYYWGDGALSLCVSREEPFRRVNSEGYTCGRDEMLKPFSRVDIRSDRHTINLK